MLSRRSVLAGLTALSACKKKDPPQLPAAPTPKPDPNREKKLIARLEPWRKKHARTAWSPELGSGTSALAASRMGGTPYLQKDEAWPSCGTCKAPLQLFVQLDTSTLPKELEGRHGTGLIQLFYCVNETCTADGYRGFSNGHLTRLITPDDKGRRGTPPPGLAPYPDRPIEKWSAFTDLPDAGEQDLLGIAIDYDFAAKTTRVKCPELGIDEAGLLQDIAEKIGDARDGDKLSGWPQWIQGPEYPSCPKCQQRMDLVFQVDSEKGIPYMFGDVGIGHITQCATHKDVLTFGWACS